MSEDQVSFVWLEEPMEARCDVCQGAFSFRRGIAAEPINILICDLCLDDRERLERALSEADVRLEWLRIIRDHIGGLTPRQRWRAVVENEVETLRNHGYQDAGIRRALLDGDVVTGHQTACIEWLQDNGMSKAEICDELKHPVPGYYECGTEH